MVVAVPGVAKNVAFNTFVDGAQCLSSAPDGSVLPVATPMVIVAMALRLCTGLNITIKSPSFYYRQRPAEAFLYAVKKACISLFSVYTQFAGKLLVIW